MSSWRCLYLLNWPNRELLRLVQEEGDYSGAVRWYRLSLAAIRFTRNRWSVWSLGLAALAEALEQYELVARLLGATDAADVTDFHLYPIERKDYGRLVAMTRAHLGGASFDTAWAQDRESSFEQVVEEAVSILEDLVGVEKQSSTA